MHLRTPPISRVERVASLAAAVSVTLATAVLVVATSRPSVAGVDGAAPSTRDAGRESEHVVYVTPPAPIRRVAPSRQGARVSGPSDVQPVITSPSRGMETDLIHDSASVSAAATNEATVRTGSTTRSTAGAPVASAMVGFRRTSQPVRFDSVLRTMTDSIGIGLATGVLKPPPLTQAEKDAKWRDEAFEVAAARNSGVPLRHTMAGGSIPVPLPFGGPSRKQRERDRAIEGQLKVMRGLRQQKVDSIVAARQRRRADSLARAADSLRHEAPSPY
jgi:hypothetical protein